MGIDTDRIECSRCGDRFAFEEPHTELVRRDFVDAPQPPSIDYLCRDCWRAYIETFLGNEFESAEIDTTTRQ